jgi:hypothetical protein
LNSKAGGLLNGKAGALFNSEVGASLNGEVGAPSNGGVGGPTNRAGAVTTNGVQSSEAGEARPQISKPLNCKVCCTSLIYLHSASTSQATPPAGYLNILNSPATSTIVDVSFIQVDMSCKWNN